ncbi:MAG: hypothetical protein WC378_17025 [Opitutaceae bacterium]
MKTTHPHNSQRGIFLAAFVLMMIFYVWTCVSDGLTWKFGREQKDHYNLLVHGFMDGQLSLKVEVSQALLDCPDPYDPAKRPPGSGLHDASFYHGKYYIYYGVVPAVVLLLPFRLLSGTDLPLAVAVLAFLSGAYAIFLLIVADCRRRFFNACGDWTSFAIALVAGILTWAPVLLRRHSMYELPISSAQFFAMLAIYALYRVLVTGARPLPWTLLGSLCWGLAIGSRPTYLLAPACLGLIVWFVPRATPGESFLKARLPLLLAALGPASLVGLGLAVYNQLRFGSPTEFGVSYILSGVYESKIRHFSLGYFSWNLGAYLTAPGEWSRYFPFYHDLAIAGPRPGQHYGMDISFGLLRHLPFLWLAGLVPLVFAFRSSHAEERKLRLFIASIAWVGVSVACFLLCFYAAMLRYIGDFGPWFGFIAVFGALAFADGFARKGRRLAGSLPVLVCAGITILLGGLFPIQVYGRISQFNPGLYSRLEALGNRPVYWWESLADGGGKGALLLSLKFPAARDGGCVEELVASGRSADRNRVLVVYPDSSHIQLAFERAGGSRIASAPLALDRSALHTLRLSMGPLYFPKNRPEFSGLSKAERQVLFRWLAVELDGRPIIDRYQRFDDSTAGPCTIGGAGGGSAFSGRILSSVREEPGVTLARVRETAKTVVMRSCVPDADGLLHLQLRFPPGEPGRREPLVVSGETGSGDFLFVEYLAPRRLRFCFEHWGRNPYLGTEIDFVPGREYLMEIRYPAPVFDPETGAISDSRDLGIRLDGHVIWETDVSSYPAEPDDFFLGRNPIGGSTCAEAFSGDIRLHGQESGQP